MDYICLSSSTNLSSLWLQQTTASTPPLFTPRLQVWPDFGWRKNFWLSMFHKEKKNDGKPLTACFHSEGPQIKIMKTQTSIEKEKLGRGRNRNVRRERKKQEERNQYEPQDLETLWGNRPSFPASLTPSNPELWKSLYNPQVDSSYTYTLHLLCKYPAKKRNAQIIIMIEENRQNVEQFSFLS